MTAAPEDAEDAGNVDAAMLASRHDERLVLSPEEEHREDGIRILHLEDLFHHGGKPPHLPLHLHVAGDHQGAADGLVGELVEKLVKRVTWDSSLRVCRKLFTSVKEAPIPFSQPGVSKSALVTFSWVKLPVSA